MKVMGAASFNPMEQAVTGLKPRTLSGTSAWQSHIPFAFAAVELLKPQLFVELGTHKGDSYFAFCQAVRHLGLPASAFAVDNWKGDEQAGLYDESIWEEFSCLNENLYQEFSKLLRMTFDEASGLFEDRSVDLLHIDGYHSYEAVRHDFERWLPKMSRSGVVLLHDTRVFAKGFGVWRLWLEKSAQYPSFEFQHGSGLGILAVGEKVPGPLKELFDAGHEKAVVFADHFEKTGAAIVC